MSITEFSQVLGNFGEFLGSIGVLATLAYLAIQVRQGSKQMRLSSYQTSAERYAALISDVARDPDRFAAFRAALNAYDASAPQQQALFHSQIYNIIQAVLHSQQLVDAGAIPDELLSEQQKDLARILKSPGGREWMTALGVDDESAFIKEVLRVGADELPLNQGLSFFQAQSSDPT